MRLAAKGDNVLVHYRGSLADGTVFENSYDLDEPADIGDRRGGYA